MTIIFQRTKMLLCFCFDPRNFRPSDLLMRVIGHLNVCRVIAMPSDAKSTKTDVAVVVLAVAVVVVVVVASAFSQV